MARITVEDCLKNERNRFSLVLLASRRAKQLLQGRTAVTDTKGNKAIVSALREIADGKVRFRADSSMDSADSMGVGSDGVEATGISTLSLSGIAGSTHH